VRERPIERDYQHGSEKQRIADRQELCAAVRVAGLFRIVSNAASADTNELIAPFSWSARFSYFTNPAQANDAATTTVPADLNTVRGLKILLAAEAADTVPGYTGPKKSPLTTAVFFKNTRIQ